MHTKILQATGPHANPSNLTVVGYCATHPKQVLEHVLAEGYALGGYRQLGQTNPYGVGLVLRGTDMEPLAKGLAVTGALQDIFPPSTRFAKGQVSEDDLRYLFSFRGGPLQEYTREPGFQSVFSPPLCLQAEHAPAMEAAREILQALGKPTSLDYILSLAQP